MKNTSKLRHNKIQNHDAWPFRNSVNLRSNTLLTNEQPGVGYAEGGPQWGMNGEKCKKRVHTPIFRSINTQLQHSSTCAREHERGEVGTLALTSTRSFILSSKSGTCLRPRDGDVADMFTRSASSSTLWYCMIRLFTKYILRSSIL